MFNLDEIIKPTQEPEALVEGLLYRGTVMLLGGDAGVGKSFLCHTLSMALASGRSFLGRACKPARVLYFDEENSLVDLREYLRWAWLGLECPSIEQLKQHLKIGHFDLTRQGGNRYNFMSELAANFQPDLIVIDTATSACGILDENDNAEASRVIAQLKRVREMAGSQTALLILKHMLFAHDPAQRRTIRGAKTWLGEVDSVVYHVARPGPHRKDNMRVTRLEPDKRRAFGLHEAITVDPTWVEVPGLGKGKGIRLTELKWLLKRK